MLGFFSFTEVTDPSAHRAYDDWHRLDHQPEQFSLDGVLFGQRWACTSACRQARVAVSPLLEPCHYMTLYLLRDAEVLPPFFALAQRLRRADHLSGPFEVCGRWVSPRVKVSEAVVPFRPARGVYVVVGPPLDGAALVARAPEGVAGAWAFADDDRSRHVTVAFVDGDLLATAQVLGQWCLNSHPLMEWAGPLECLDTGSPGWFDRLTPQ